ncbi:MAG TPA: methyltransferase [Chloroflexota bacterium]|nr:methyltransferase [Chloroflexota bacterium]
MTTSESSPRDALLRTVNAYQISRAAHVAASLGIADLLAAGPRDIDDLAAATQTQASTLYRLLRALASVGIFAEVEDADGNRRFALTPQAQYLRSDTPGSVRNWAVLMGRPYYQQAWAYLDESIKTGQAVFPTVHGATLWEYRQAHPEEGAIFDAAMTGMSGGATAAIVAGYDFSGFASLVDVGGGHGELIAAILAANPGLRGVLFDQPHVVAGAPSLLARAGIADRCEVVGGSFFDAVPGGAEVYLLMSIVHDWDDDSAVRILRICRSAMSESSRLLLIEQVVAPPNQPDRAKIGDLNMLVLHGGRERTADEFRALLASAGLRLSTIRPTRIGQSLLESVPA